MREFVTNVVKNEPSDGNRAEAIDILARYRSIDVPTRDLIRAHLASASGLVRSCAAQALAKHGNADDVPHLEAMAASDPRDLARNAAYDAIDAIRKRK